MSDSFDDPKWAEAFGYEKQYGDKYYSVLPWPTLSETTAELNRIFTDAYVKEVLCNENPFLKLLKKCDE